MRECENTRMREFYNSLLLTTKK